VNTDQPDFSGIRVWRGFRSKAYLGDSDKRKDFIKALNEVFIPQTAQQMMPLGLEAYFPAISHEFDKHADFFVPDEVALVIYPRAAVYERAAKLTVAGRAYGALHGTVFNFSGEAGLPISGSIAPEAWRAGWEWDRAYSLLSETIQWHSGSVSVLLAKPRSDRGGLTFYREVDRVVTKWKSETRRTIDGGILYTNRDWLLYWEHCVDGTSVSARDSESLIPRFREFLQAPNVDAKAKPIAVPPAFTQDDKGVSCVEGELLNVSIIPS